MSKGLAIIFGPAVSQSLKDSILESLKERGELTEPIDVDWHDFPDGERRPKIKGNLRRKDTYIINSTQPPAQNMEDLCMLLYAAQQATTERLTAVIPYYGRARQDRKDQPHVPVTAKLVAQYISVAMDGKQMQHIIFFHPHFPALPGYFDFPSDVLYPHRIFHEAIKEMFPDLSNVSIVALDAGAFDEVQKYANELGAPYVFIEKFRNKTTGKTEAGNVIGNVSGRHCIIIDDIADTCGSIAGAKKVLDKAGAEGASFFATHGMFSDNASENLAKANLTNIVTTDSLFGRPVPPNTKVLTIGRDIALAIWCNYHGLSLSSYLGDFGKR